MKINVYKEQYKSSQAHHDPGKIGFGTDPNRFVQLGNTVLNAAYNKMEKDDEFNSARIEADTKLAADKLYREFQETANPDDFEGDVERQRSSIQNLIKQQSQQFKLPKHQNAFIEKMTRGLETQYMGDTLKYSYELQETRYKELGQTAFDSYKAQLLAGNRFITVPDTMEAMREYYTTLAKRYHIPQDKLDEYIKDQNTSIVKSYAYGMIRQNPQVVRDLLVGNSFDKFRAYKESQGEAFEMDRFWQDDTLRKEYQESEFGAQWTDVIQYLDYDTRIDLWKLAEGEIDNQNKKKQQQQLLTNSKSDWEVTKKKEATIAEIKETGEMPVDMLGIVTVTNADDPAIGTKNTPVAMGQISYGKIEPGNKISDNAKHFAGGISGIISAQGYKVRVTSNIRPNDKGSKHVDGSAVDLQILGKDGKLSEQGTITAYKAALGLYGNNIRQKSVLFEVDPSRLDAIKQQLEADGVDTSFVNWEQSKIYGAKNAANGGAHIHFGITKDADYTVTNSGDITELKFRTPLGKMRYDQKRADGKSVQEAYDAARQDELEVYKVYRGTKFVKDVVNTKNKDGSLLDPTAYGRVYEQLRANVRNNKNLSDTDRIEYYAALDYAETELKALQELYKNDTVAFIQKTNPGISTEDAQIIQVQRYGIAPSEAKALTDTEASVKADQIFNQYAPEKAVKELTQYGINSATIRQLAKHAPKGDYKATMLLYSSMANDEAKAQIISACKDWDKVELEIKQNVKNFPSNWYAAFVKDFKSNTVIKDYIEDVAKTNPEQASQLYDAAAGLYAYKIYKGGTNKKNIIKDIANDLVGHNFNTITVNSPRQGNSNLSIAKNAFQGGDLHKIKRVSDIASKLGIDQNVIYTPNRVDLSQSAISEVDKATREAALLRQKHSLDGITKTTKLSSTPDGLGAVFTWKNANGVTSGTNILNQATKKPFVISYKDMVDAYNEAYKLTTSWLVENTNSTYRIPRNALGEQPYQYGVKQSAAMDVALEHVLSNKFPWLAQSKYSVFYTGNIMLKSRPKVTNEDGSVSTIRSMSYTDNKTGKQVLIPTVSDEGTILSEKDAIKYWKKKGQNLGEYNTVDEANKAAEQLHKHQARYYGLE